MPSCPRPRRLPRVLGFTPPPPCFVLVPLLFGARSDGPEPICMSSPLWVAAFRLAAVSIAAGEAAPVASCSIPATGRDGGRDGRGENSSR